MQYSTVISITKREAGEPTLHPGLHHESRPSPAPCSPQLDVTGQLLKVTTKNTPTPSSLTHTLNRALSAGNRAPSAEASGATSAEKPRVGWLHLCRVPNATCEPRTGLLNIVLPTSNFQHHFPDVIQTVLSENHNFAEL